MMQGVPPMMMPVSSGAMTMAPPYHSMPITTQGMPKPLFPAAAVQVLLTAFHKLSIFLSFDYMERLISFSLFLVTFQNFLGCLEDSVL